MKTEYIGVICGLITICSFLIGRVTALKKNTEDEVSCKINQQRDIKDLQLAIERIEITMKELFNNCAKQAEIELLKNRLTNLERKIENEHTI